METFQIEKGIPIAKFCKKYKYPLDEMEIGDSFLIPCKTEKELNVARVNYRQKANRLKPKQFAGRTVENGFRIWRFK